MGPRSTCTTNCCCLIYCNSFAMPWSGAHLCSTWLTVAWVGVMGLKKVVIVFCGWACIAVLLSFNNFSMCHDGWHAWERSLIIMISHMIKSEALTLNADSIFSTAICFILPDVELTMKLVYPSCLWSLTEVTSNGDTKCLVFTCAKMSSSHGINMKALPSLWYRLRNPSYSQLP